jgi:hypothetical protein
MARSGLLILREEEAVPFKMRFDIVGATMLLANGQTLMAGNKNLIMAG